MKKLNYFLTVVAGTMMLASCSNDKDVVVSPSDNAVQQIVLQVASNGDGLTTRAGRPLLSNEASQDIDVVDIYIVSKDKDNNTVLNYSYPNFSWDDATEYGTKTGKMKTLTIPEDKVLPNGSYTIYALGHTATDDSDYDIPTFGTEDGQTAISEIENYVLEYKATDESHPTRTPEEIFAGSVDLEVKGNFSKAIVLNRQVAGAYFYVYNLPMVANLDENCELQLVASDSNNQLVLGNFANNDITGNGNNTGTNVMYVVNGTKEAITTTSKVICSSKISNWYSKTEDKDGDKIVDTDNWIGTANASSRQGAGYVKGSIFAASFVIPFKKVDNTQTLKLQIVKEGADEPLQSWKVNLPDAPGKIWNFNGSAFVEITGGETKNNYSIVRNHLYSVGTKSKPGKPTDPDPENPDPTDPDPNDPQDLTKGQNITLHVNHNWEVIYKMELE